MRGHVDHDRLAAEAFERIRKSGQHWRDWTYIARGFAEGRNKAMCEGSTNEPVGRGYNEAFSRWLNDPTRRHWASPAHGGIDKATRNHLLWVADHLVQLEEWRETLAASQRYMWNHPTTVKKQYERMHRAKVLRGQPVLTPMEQLKEALREATEDAARWKRQAEESGSLFDLRRDTPEEIARAVVDSSRPSKVSGPALHLSVVKSNWTVRSSRSLVNQSRLLAAGVGLAPQRT